MKYSAILKLSNLESKKPIKIGESVKARFNKQNIVANPLVRLFSETKLGIHGQ